MNADTGNKTSAIFLKLGGTWDMTEDERGKLTGSGGLDDTAIREIEDKAYEHVDGNSLRMVQAERDLATEMMRQFESAPKGDIDAGEHFKSWCPGFGDLVSARFEPVFSGDSSHLRNSLSAAMTMYIIGKLLVNPKRVVIGAQGTDTADIAILPLLDALLWDTDLPPVILTGANRSHREDNSDASRNFMDLARITRMGIGAGSFWVFGGYLYRGCDLMKVDPTETRPIEGQTTFLGCHQSSMPIGPLMSHAKSANPAEWQCPNDDHLFYRMNVQTLYNTMNDVYTIDLGSQNSIHTIMEGMRHPCNRAIVMAAHSLGNVSNPIKDFSIKEARRGKLIIDTSRCLVGAVSARYAGSLLDINDKELAGTGRRIIAAHKLNKSMARALAVRAILEKLDQEQTQQLFDNYCASRNML